MPNGNRGRTSLKCRPRAANKMREFDNLPPLLRQWVASSTLPWRPGSVKKAYARALRRTGNEATALAELQALQSRLVAKDARAIWGADHPNANVSS